MMRILFDRYRFEGWIAFVGILIGSVLVAGYELHPVYRQNRLRSLACLAPFWVPIVLASYALGQRGIGWRLLLALAVGEAAALYGMRWSMMP